MVVSMYRPILLAFYSLAVLTHVLVMAKVIPHDWVNGGRSPSYAVQAAQSALSIVVLLALFAFVWRLMGRATVGRAQWGFLLVVTVLLALGAALQLLGTTFERDFMLPLLLTGLTGHLMLAGDLRPRRSARYPA